MLFRFTATQFHTKYVRIVLGRNRSEGWSVRGVMTSKRKIIWVAAFILMMAVAIVLCVELFGAAREIHYDGTLVRGGTRYITPVVTAFSMMRQ
jgi:hypothetical protein